MYKTFVGRTCELSRWFLIALVAAFLAPATVLAAESRAALERDARSAYQKLIAGVPAAKMLSREALAVLVFPTITKAGLVVGGQYGDGVLFMEQSRQRATTTPPVRRTECRPVRSNTVMPCSS
jgi:lipid-binding SYLF domain-containing protein